MLAELAPESLCLLAPPDDDEDLKNGYGSKLTGLDGDWTQGGSREEGSKGWFPRDLWSQKFGSFMKFPCWELGDSSVHSQSQTCFEASKLLDPVEHLEQWRVICALLRELLRWRI